MQEKMTKMKPFNVYNDKGLAARIALVVLSFDKHQHNNHWISNAQFHTICVSQFFLQCRDHITKYHSSQTDLGVQKIKVNIKSHIFQVRS
jgi:hypothetical protein